MTKLRDIAAVIALDVYVWCDFQCHGYASCMGDVWEPEFRESSRSDTRFMATGVPVVVNDGRGTPYDRPVLGAMWTMTAVRLGTMLDVGANAA